MKSVNIKAVNSKGSNTVIHTKSEEVLQPEHRTLSVHLDEQDQADLSYRYTPQVSVAHLSQNKI